MPSHNLPAWWPVTSVMRDRPRPAGSVIMLGLLAADQIVGDVATCQLTGRRIPVPATHSPVVATWLTGVGDCDERITIDGALLNEGIMGCCRRLLAALRVATIDAVDATNQLLTAWPSPPEPPLPQSADDGADREDTPAVWATAATRAAHRRLETALVEASSLLALIDGPVVLLRRPASTDGMG